MLYFQTWTLKTSALIYTHVLTPFLTPFVPYSRTRKRERNVQRKMNVTARENGIVSVSADTGYQPNMQHEKDREKNKRIVAKFQKHAFPPMETVGPLSSPHTRKRRHLSLCIKPTRLEYMHAKCSTHIGKSSKVRILCPCVVRFGFRLSIGPLHESEHQGPIIRVPSTGNSRLLGDAVFTDADGNGLGLEPKVLSSKISKHRVASLQCGSRGRRPRGFEAPSLPLDVSLAAAGRSGVVESGR